MTPETRLPRIITVAFLVSGVIGVAMLAFLPERVLPFRPGSGDDVAGLILADREATYSRYYALYVDLRDDAGGGTVIVPAEHPLDEYAAWILANTELVGTDYDSTVDEATVNRLGEEAEDRGEYENRFSHEEFEYLILDGSGSLRLLTRESTLVIVPETRWRQLTTEESDG